MSDVADRYEISAYRPELREDMLDLQRYLWGDDLERNAAHFCWKYERNPYSDVYFCRLALCGGRVVGTVGMVAAEWEAGRPTERFLCLTHADGVVHPDHRRRGLFERMTRALLDDGAQHGLSYVIALSANPVSAASDMKMGWRSAGTLETASRYVDGPRKSALREAAAKLPFLRQVYRRVRRQVTMTRATGEQTGHSFAALDGARGLGEAAADPVSISPSPRPDAMAELIQRIGHDGRIRQTRDRRFFAWRFENPLSTYRFLYWEGVKLEGYLVLQVPAVAEHGNWVHIVDWEASDMQVRAALLEAAIRCCPSQLLVTWSETMPREVKALLEAHGFRSSNSADPSANANWQPLVLVRALGREAPAAGWDLAGRSMLDLAGWDLRPIYSDNF